jgi:hypothetical protein
MITTKKKPKYKTLEDYCEQQIKKNNVNMTNFIYKRILDQKKAMTLIPTYYSIIKFFYNFLKINCLYVYKIDDDFYKIVDRNTDYDIIIIDYTYVINNVEKIKRNVKNNTGKLLDGMIEYLEDKNIRYNGELYEIDYILHATDNNITCEECGHCISNIHYNGEEYYYNSSDSITKIQCVDTRVKIPCSLIKQEWKSRMDSDTCYKLPKCKYIPEYKHQKLDPYLKEIIKNSSEDNICFNRNVNMRVCYVRK